MTLQRKRPDEIDRGVFVVGIAMVLVISYALWCDVWGAAWTQGAGAGLVVGATAFSIGAVAQYSLWRAHVEASA